MHKLFNGRTLLCNDIIVEIDSELSTRDAHELGECVTVVRGRFQGNKEPVVVKLRIELSPEETDEIDHRDRDGALRIFLTEAAALEDLTESGHTPRYITIHERSQEDWMPCPGGYLRMIVMSKLEGQNVRTVLLDLTDDERHIIRSHLTETLEYMRRKGWAYRDQKPENLLWDKDAQQTNLVDFDLAELKEPYFGHPIMPGDNDVEMFGVWNQYARRSHRETQRERLC